MGSYVVFSQYLIQQQDHTAVYSCRDLPLLYYRPHNIRVQAYILTVLALYVSLL